MALLGHDAMPAPQGGTPAWGRKATGIFLHAGWRSCGTWIWERLRENEGVQGFYEPLHEDLASLRAHDIAQLRPDSWQSGHGIGAPYFAEFAPLLSPHRGVRGYAPRFAFNDYFLPPGRDDAALEHYLRSLVANAVADGRLPVLKFCRSLGRVPWMEARFPDMLHVVILRDPQAQWRSARQQMEHSGNRYFVVAPFAILARNSKNTLLMNVAERLRVKWPPGLGRSLTRDLSVTADTCWRHVSRLSWQDRFRGFLALWVASGITSLASAATLIDADCLAGDAPARRAAEMALSSAVGLPVNLTSHLSHVDQTAADEGERADAAQAMQSAAAFLALHAAQLHTERAVALASKLQSPGMPLSKVQTRYGALRAGPIAYADAVAYVAVMRALHPLRRAHFHTRRWMGGDAAASGR